jgi:Ala-tRNA(Pro) deacylase
MISGLFLEGRPMDIISWLTQQKTPFEHRTHPEVFTAQEVAQAEHVPGREMAKVVLVKSEKGFALAVLPSAVKVNLDKLAGVLGAASVALATESEMANRFPDVEVGAEPPFGHLYKLPTVVEERLAHQSEIVFQAGTHRDTVKMRFADYQRLAKPMIGTFGEPT